MKFGKQRNRGKQSERQRLKRAVLESWDTDRTDVPCTDGQVSVAESSDSIYDITDNYLRYPETINNKTSTAKARKIYLTR